MIFLEKLEEHVLSIFVRDVSDHNRGSPIELNIFNVNDVGFRLLIADCSSVAH